MSCGRLLRSLTTIGMCAAMTFPAGAVAVASPASVVDASNHLAMMVANKRPMPTFQGSTIISPPGLWLTYAAVYISARRDQLGPANIMGYAEKPSHDRVLSDAAGLKASARGSNMSMRLWIHANADVEGTARSELRRLGVSVLTQPINSATYLQLNSWVSQLSQGAFHKVGTKVDILTTGVLFTSVQHQLAFPSSVREASVVAPSRIATTGGMVKSLPGKPIAYYSDAIGVTGIRLQTQSGRFFLFTGSSNDLQRMLDGLSIPKWEEMKTRFADRPGRIVDSFVSQSVYNFSGLASIDYDTKLWNGEVDESLQQGSINFDSNKLVVSATTEFAQSECCIDYMVFPQSETQFQWSSLAPLVFIDEAPSGLILFIGYRL